MTLWLFTATCQVTHYNITCDTSIKVAAKPRDEIFISTVHPQTLIAFEDMRFLIAFANSVNDQHVQHLGFFGDQKAFACYFGRGIGTITVHVVEATVIIFVAKIIGNHCSSLQVFTPHRRNVRFDQSQGGLTNNTCFCFLSSYRVQQITFRLQNMTITDMFSSGHHDLVGSNKHVDITSGSSVGFNIAFTGKKHTMVGNLTTFDEIPGFWGMIKNMNRAQLVSNIDREGEEHLGPTLAPRTFPEEYIIDNTNEEQFENDYVIIVILLVVCSFSIIVIIVSLVIRWRINTWVVEVIQNDINLI